MLSIAVSFCLREKLVFICAIDGSRSSLFFDYALPLNQLRNESIDPLFIARPKEEAHIAQTMINRLRQKLVTLHTDPGWGAEIEIEIVEKHKKVLLLGAADVES